MWAVVALALAAAPSGDTVFSLQARLDALEATWNTSYAALEEEIVEACAGCPPDAPDTSHDAVIADLQRQLDELAEAAAQSGQPGKDGYCAIPPNETHAFVPMTRYVYSGSGIINNLCATGGPANRGGRYSSTRPSMMSVERVHDECTWGHYMSDQPILAYVGDSLVFWRGGQQRWNLLQFENEVDYINCNMEHATMVATLDDFAAIESTGRNFTMNLTEPRTYYFTSSNLAGNPREDCISFWQARVVVIVMEPGKEVLAKCPLFDGGRTGDVADSATVQKLKGAVAAMGRQMVATEQRTAERLREEGQSGVTVVRTYNGGTDSYYSASYSETGAANMHNHADTHHTVGLGEFGAVLNGVQFTTRHNDYSLLEPDDSLTVDEFKSTWPPRAKGIEQPPVPPTVLTAGSVEAQMAEMREYFRAFHTQNVTHRDYRPYFHETICYLEGTWTEAADDIAEPFASERHHIDAATWTELTQKNNFLFNNGQKDNSENLPYLPTSFRGMKEDGDDTFEPIMAQWFYRISCKKLSEHLPTTNLRVRNDIHIQMAESTPSTRAKLASNPRALFDLHPNPDDGEWPKGKTGWELLDDLMYTIPGFDGPNADLVDNSFGETCGTYHSGEVLNSARYTRYFALLSKDAMGRSTKKRSFNDMLFAAQTTHPRVSPQAVCEGSVDVMPTADARDTERIALCETLGEDECRSQDPWTAAEVTVGSSGAKCMWVSGRCEYQKCWEQRWSYAIPLEIVYLTPLSEWNPYNIPYITDYNSPDYDAVRDGRDGSPDRPYRYSRQDTFFRTPVEFFGDLADVDEADTSGGATYVLDSSGTRRAVRASGHWMLFPEMDGMHVRQRYPIFPVHEQGSTIWKEAKAIEELIMGKDNEYIKAIIAEQRAQNYGLVLELTGRGHSHEITISPAELRSLKSGSVTSLHKVTSVGNGHQHFVQLDYDATASAGNEWSMDWCTMGADTTVCGVSTGCSAATATPYCCAGECPDGHSGVSVV